MRRKLYDLEFRLSEPNQYQFGEHPYHTQSGQRLAQAIDSRWTEVDLIKRDGYSTQLTDTFRRPGCRNIYRDHPPIEQEAIDDYHKWSPRSVVIVSYDTADIIMRANKGHVKVEQYQEFIQIEHKNAPNGFFWCASITHPSPINKKWDEKIEQTKEWITKGIELASRRFQRQ
jgi:hypothetical protein